MGKKQTEVQEVKVVMKEAQHFLTNKNSLRHLDLLQLQCLQALKLCVNPLKNLNNQSKKKKLKFHNQKQQLQKKFGVFGRVHPQKLAKKRINKSLTRKRNKKSLTRKRNKKSPTRKR